MAEGIAESFIQKFHSLEGTTIGERKKQLFIFLKQHSSIKGDADALNLISSNLQPQTFLEELFKLEVLVYFRRSSELYELLKEGNAIFIAKIVKQEWFFKDIFEKVSAEQLVNEVLPCLSFSARMKVLNKLRNCLSEPQFDGVFQAVSNRYGIAVAEKFITACSPKKVRSVFEEHPLKLTPSQLKVLFLKDHKLIDDYAKEYLKHTDDNPNSVYDAKLVNFIVKSDLNLFFDEYRDRHEYLVRLGKRASKKVAALKKGEIISDPNKYKRNLKMAAVVRKFGGHSVEAKTLFLNLLSPKYSEFHLHSTKSVLSLYPKQLQCSLFVDSLNSKYGDKILDFQELLSTEVGNLLQELPGNPYKEEVARLKIQLGDFSRVKYLKPSDAIPLLKEAINVCTVIPKRSDLINELLNCCRNNGDVEAFFEVLKYFLNRHKNEDESVYTQFTSSIENDLCGYLKGKLTEEMWECLREIYAFRKLKFDTDPSDIFELSYVKAALDEGKPTDQLLLQYFENKQKDKYAHWLPYKVGLEFKKYLITFASEHARKIAKSEEELEELYLKITANIINYNQSCGDVKDKILFGDYPGLIKALTIYIKKTEKSADSNVQSFVRSVVLSRPNDLKSSFQSFYWEKFLIYGEASHFEWFLKFEPLALVENANVFTSNIHNSTSKTFWIIKQYSHLSLDERCLTYCVENIGKVADRKWAESLVRCFSILATPTRYKEFADSYKPSHRKLDLKDADAKGKYQLQCDIAMYYKNTNNYRMLPSLLNYCMGDYFGSAIHSLNSLLYHTPEVEVIKVLEELSTKAVSVRKHAFLYTCELCSIQTRLNILEVLNQKEKDASLRTRMFTTCLQYFIRNPCDAFFDLVMRNMDFINASDSESLSALISRTYEVAKKYRGRYTLFVWEFLCRKLTDNPRKLKQMLESILNCLNSSLVIPQLPLEFCVKIIQENFFKTNKTCLSSHVINRFVPEVIKYRPERILLAQQYLFPVLCREPDKRKVFTFFNEIYWVILQNAIPPEFTEVFINFFQTLIDPVLNFNRYLCLFLLKLRGTVVSGDYKTFNTHVSAYILEIVTKFGPSVLRFFARVLKDSLYVFKNDDVSIYDFHDDLLRNHSSVYVCLVLISVLPTTPPPPSEEDEVRKYKEVLRLLGEVPDLEVKVNFNLKFGAYGKDVDD